MNKVLLALCLLLSFIALACNDNLYSSMEKKHSKDADQSNIDFAFIQGNCQVVIDAYQQRAQSGNLSYIEFYKYNSSVLACTGFDLIRGLNGILGTDIPSDDSFALIQNVMGVSDLTADKSSWLQSRYGIVINSCNPMDNMTDDMKIVCGMTAAVDTVRGLGDIALVISRYPNVSITEDGMKAAIKGADNDSLITGIMDSHFMDNVSRNMNMINIGAATMARQTGIDSFSSGLKKFTRAMAYDNGTIDKKSIANYLFINFGGGNSVKRN